MRILDLSQALIADLVLPGNMRERAAKVRDLPEAPRPEPVMRRVGKKNEGVLSGFDHIAWHMLKGLTHVRVRLVECSDEEAEMIRTTDGLNVADVKANGKQRAMLDLVDILTDQLMKERPELPRQGSGKRRTARSLAREAVAVRFGVTPATVRNAEHRAKAVRDTKPDAPEFRTVGMELTPEFQELVTHVQKILRGLAQSLSTRAGYIMQMQGIPQAKAAYLSDRMRECATLAREMVPASLCPFCKGLGGELQESCTACFGTACIVKAQLEIVPAELWDEENQRVMSRGKLASASDFDPGPGSADSSNGSGGNQQKEGESFRDFSSPRSADSAVKATDTGSPSDDWMAGFG